MTPDDGRPTRLHDDEWAWVLLPTFYWLCDACGDEGTVPTLEDAHAALWAHLDPDATGNVSDDEVVEHDFYVAANYATGVTIPLFLHGRDAYPLGRAYGHAAIKDDDGNMARLLDDGRYTKHNRPDPDEAA